MKAAGTDWEVVACKLHPLQQSYQEQWAPYDAEHKKLTFYGDREAKHRNAALVPKEYGEQQEGNRAEHLRHEIRPQLRPSSRWPDRY